ncbi:MAG TPA: helix-turn-helix domain-containing protein [Planctomycetaceae bacterium]|nr:helix-turn-helix domain-containing protein [Planctomycetaceae bacterium]
MTQKRGRPASADLHERRTEEILAAAAKLFAERGYADADTQELADRLGVGKGTLYRYFPSKRELFLAAADLGMRRLTERIDATLPPDGDPLESMSQGIQTYLEYFDQHPELVELLILERAQFKDRKTPTYFEHRERNSCRWEEAFRGLMAAGRIREMPVERLLGVLGDLIYGTMFTNHFTGRRGSYRIQAEEIVDFVLYGILTDRERSTRPQRSAAGRPLPAPKRVKR